MGLDPKVLKLKAAELQQARMITEADLTFALETFADPGDANLKVRILRRNDDVTNQNQNGMGIIQFAAPDDDASVAFSANGVTDLIGLRRYLAAVNEPSRALPDGFAAGDTSGRAEVEFFTKRGWVNAKTGEVNREVIVAIDGQSGGGSGYVTQPGI